MSVADIFKLQTGYNLHDKFNDQTNWQDAFKIANAFAETSEKHRANRENLATSDNRVQQMNANFLEQTAKSNLAQAKTLAEQQWADFFRENAVDEMGKLRTAEELFGFAQQHPNLNPFAFFKAAKDYQDYTTSVAKEVAPFAPQYAADSRYLAGLSPMSLTPEGIPIIPSTGVELSPFSTAEALERFAAGGLGAFQDNMYKMQQQAEKEKAIQAARLPYTLEAIQARSDAAQAKQQGWIEHKDVENDWKVANGFIDNVFNSGADQTAIARQIDTLVKTYPHLKEQIGKAVQLRLSQLSAQ